MVCGRRNPPPVPNAESKTDAPAESPRALSSRAELSLTCACAGERQVVKQHETKPMGQKFRRAKLAFSWIEISLALVLFALALWITAVDWNAGPESDPHGYVAATVFFGLLMALTLLVSGLLLRARTRSDKGFSQKSFVFRVLCFVDRIPPSRCPTWTDVHSRRETWRRERWSRPWQSDC